MNIFSSLKSYAGKWSVCDSRGFTDEEKKAVKSATVVASQYGNSACFLMRSGTQHFIPMSNDSTLGIGENINLDKAMLLTLERAGEANIYRVSI